MKWQYFQRIMHTGRIVCLVLWYDSDYFNPYHSGFLQWYWESHAMGLLPDTQHCRLRMHRLFRERFPRPRLQGKPLVSDPCMHHVGIANPWWQGKRSQHSRRMRNPQFYVSGKRPIVQMPVKHPQIILANPSQESTRKDDVKCHTKAQQTFCIL